MLYLFILMVILLILSFLVVFSKNTIVSMLCLIWCFIFSGCFFLLLGAEFLTFTLIIVYGSAVSILFLFIIMLLNLRLIEIYYVNYYYIPLCLLISIFLIFISVIFLLENYSFFFFNNLILENNNSFIWINYLNLFKYHSNLFNFGIILYNYYYIFVILAGFILLLAMIGSILLVTDNKIDKVVSHDQTKRKCLLKNYYYV
jgi:NADH-ubiquinone oxidoreductase chain 6